jgi:anhydro-N-acetylmuramic acid kinase
LPDRTPRCGPELYIGIMSGTSLDGIDAALVEFSGGEAAPSIKLHATFYQPYDAAFKQTLLALHRPASDELHQAQLAANDLARRYAAAASALLQQAGVTSAEVRAIGCHGQTIRHRPECGYTLQLGNAALLAELCNITAVGDFRSRDIAAGGQGAPLVPAFHDRMLRHPDMHRVIVNIGGISNLTDLPPQRPASGFDCGPGNLLMDAWIEQWQGEPYDKDGAWAASGSLIPGLLRDLLKEPFLRALPPKSCGREQFNLDWLRARLRGGEPPADVQATLLELTARAIGDSIRRHCDGAREVYLCGGGAHNRTLLQRLRAILPECRVDTTEPLGLAPDWMEAIAFAWLAQQALHEQRASLPAVTGARHPCVLGAIYRA